MSKGKEKIIEFLNERIESLSKVVHEEKDEQWKKNFDYWDQVTRRILGRVFGNDILKAYLERLNYDPSPIELGFSEEDWRMHQIMIRGSIEEAKKIGKRKFLMKGIYIIHFLQALREETNFFNDSETEKYTKKLKRFWKLKPGYLTRPFIDGEVGMEEEKGSQD